MKFSLRNRLSLSYILIALVCMVLVGIIANYSLEKQFRSYVIQNQEKQNKEVVTLINQQYLGEGKWKKEFIQDIGVYALENGMIIEVMDLKGDTIWNATEYNYGLCERMMDQMSRNMMSRYPNWKGEYKENSYPLTYGTDTVGHVNIGYYGPFFFNERDLAFINTLNKAFVGVGFLALVFALVLGYLMAKQLSNPISRVINTAQMISKGYFGDRSSETSSIKEINQLVTTVNNMADTLEKQELLRKRLTADVAHELRTPLATLQSHMEAMIDGIWQPDSKRLKSCHEEILRIGRMVGDLEKLAKYESENIILNKQVFDLTELTKSILLNFEKDYMTKNITVRIDAAKAEIEADKDKISQVLINLIANALKFTPKDGSVFIKVTEASNSVSFEIRDTGVGIGQEDLPHIFERFYRADKSRSRITGGSGIGLTIAKTIVDSHKGSISVDSKPGEGTAFNVTIPRK